MGYDIIGDIHGHAGKLTALLRKLGYRHHLGAWRHLDRSAIFVGDLIDRGPGQLETIRIVREMLDAGTAQSVMGNHEFNAIAWYMPDPACDGAHLRRRDPENRKQHQAFLDEAEGNPHLHTELVRWFLTLPLWLDLPGLRVVHACWHPGYMAEIAPHLNPGQLLDPVLVVAGSRPGSMEFRPIEGLTKGLEIALPPGHTFQDKGGKRAIMSVSDGGTRPRILTGRPPSSVPSHGKRRCPTCPFRKRHGLVTPTRNQCSSATTGGPAIWSRCRAMSRASTSVLAQGVRWLRIAGMGNRYCRRATLSAMRDVISRVGGSFGEYAKEFGECAKKFGEYAKKFGEYAKKFGAQSKIRPT